MWHTSDLSTWELEALEDQESEASLCLSETLTQNTGGALRRKLDIWGSAVLWQRAAGTPQWAVSAQSCVFG